MRGFIALVVEYLYLLGWLVAAGAILLFLAF